MAPRLKTPLLHWVTFCSYTEHKESEWRNFRPFLPKSVCFSASAISHTTCTVSCLICLCALCGVSLGLLISELQNSNRSRCEVKYRPVDWRQQAYGSILRKLISTKHTKQTFSISNIHQHLISKGSELVNLNEAGKSEFHQVPWWCLWCCSEFCPLSVPGTQYNMSMHTADIQQHTNDTQSFEWNIKNSGCSPYNRLSGRGLRLMPLGQLGSLMIWPVLGKAFDILVLM